ncbi:hypothetical protein [Streptomyces aureocirculatus]|uniref:hypothetical protein n=1 Tax=Streptomyces aureocirculatus TaxID=67275 RepID=UPI0004C518A9
MGHAAEEAPSHTGETEPGYWRRFGEGFTFLRREPLLLTVIMGTTPAVADPGPISAADCATKNGVPQDNGGPSTAWLCMALHGVMEEA